MLNIQEIESLIKEKDIAIVGNTISAGNQTFYVFIKTILDANQKQTPSSYLLNTISQSLKEQGATIYFIQINEQTDDLDGSLRTCLFGYFPSLLRNSYLSIDNKKASVWIEPKVTLRGTVASIATISSATAACGAGRCTARRPVAISRGCAS